MDIVQVASSRTKTTECTYPTLISPRGHGWDVNGRLLRLLRQSLAGARHSDSPALCGVVRGAGGESSEHRVLAARVLLEGPEGVRGRGSDREEARDGRGGRLGVVGHVDEETMVRTRGRKWGS